MDNDLNKQFSNFFIIKLYYGICVLEAKGIMGKQLKQAKFAFGINAS